MRSNQTTHLTNQLSPKKTNDILLWFVRILVGGLFIFSGLIKANDPIGFGYKLDEYFLVFNLEFLSNFSSWMAIFLCALEIIFGALLILGFQAKKVAWGLLLLIIFFTFLTFYSAFFEVVTSCGCFGDAIPLTPWQSFIKDIVLLILIVFIFRYKHQITPIVESSFTRALISTFIVVASFGIGVYTYSYLPFIDFLPYKVGNNIPEQMTLPEGKEPDVYEHIYNLKNKASGESKEVTDKVYMDEKIWEDENWEIVGEPKSRLVKKGYQIPIADLLISNNEGYDVTEEIITNPYYNFIIVSTSLHDMTPIDLKAFDDINQTIRELAEDYNFRAVLLTSSSMDEVFYLNDQLDLVLETFYADPVPLKSMVRSNPGILLLQNGTVIHKWSKHSFPDKEELEKQYFANTK